MPSLIFSTGNSVKFLVAQHACAKHGVELIQQDVEVVEIQNEDPGVVARDKGQKAYDAIKKPVIITDDSWNFKGLKGFPGVYMHSMNEWFTSEDFLNLTKPLKNRDVIFTQYLVYTDEKGQKVFRNDTKGTLLNEARGTSHLPSHTVISLESDNGLSIAEAYQASADTSKRPAAKIWHDFLEWSSENN